jgi:hypothetical protein
MKVAYAGIFVAVAFIAGAFISSPELRAYAAATITSADIVDGQVKNADIATNAITTSKINDGAVKTADIGNFEVGTADISVDFMSRTLLYDGSSADWNPDGTKTSFSINDSHTKASSIILVNTSLTDAVCNAEHPIDGAFSIVCNKAPNNGSYVQYLIINR